MNKVQLVYNIRDNNAVKHFEMLVIYHYNDKLTISASALHKDTTRGFGRVYVDTPETCDSDKLAIVTVSYSHHRGVTFTTKFLDTGVKPPYLRRRTSLNNIVILDETVKRRFESHTNMRLYYGGGETTRQIDYRTMRYGDYYRKWGKHDASFYHKHLEWKNSRIIELLANSPEEIEQEFPETITISDVYEQEFVMQ